MLFAASIVSQCRLLHFQQDAWAPKSWLKSLSVALVIFWWWFMALHPLLHSCDAAPAFQESRYCSTLVNYYNGMEENHYMVVATRNQSKNMVIFLFQSTNQESVPATPVIIFDEWCPQALSVGPRNRMIPCWSSIRERFMFCLLS